MVQQDFMLAEQTDSRIEALLAFLRRQKGVCSAEQVGSAKTPLVRVVFREKTVDEEKLLVLFSREGCRATLCEDEPARLARLRRVALRTRFVVARRRFVGCFLIAFLLLYAALAAELSLPILWWADPAAQPVFAAAVQAVLAIAVCICGMPLLVRGISALFHGKPCAESVLSLGVLAAVAHGVVCLVGFSGALPALYWEQTGILLTLGMAGDLLAVRAEQICGTAQPAFGKVPVRVCGAICGYLPIFALLSLGGNFLAGKSAVSALGTAFVTVLALTPASVPLVGSLAAGSKTPFRALKRGIVVSLVCAIPGTICASGLLAGIGIGFSPLAATALVLLSAALTAAVTH